MARPPIAITRLTDQMEPRIARAFLDAIEDMTTSANISALTAHIEAGNTEAIMRSLNLQADMLAPLDRAITETFVQGGRYEIGKHSPPDPDGVGPLVIRFDGRNPRAEAWALALSSKLIVEILDDQREMVRMVIQDGIARGVNPRQTALELVGRMDPITRTRQGGFIGLTAQEGGYVMNAKGELIPGYVPRAREQLTSGTPADLRAYLKRTRRDKRFDHHVLRALDTGEPIPASTVDRMVMRYKDRLLKTRGDRIARTETLTALNAGRKEGFDQLVEAAGIPRDRTKKIWRATGDSRTRDTHLIMDRQERAKDEPFVTPSGFQMQHPGDVSLGAPPSETIQCRCWMEYKVDYLGMAGDGD